MGDPEWNRNIEWNRSREWTRRHVTWLLETIRADLRQERFSRDFWDKLRERGITLQQLWKDFLTEFENYELGVQKILPAYISGRYTNQDHAFADEVGHTLHARDCIEQDLHRFGVKLAGYFPRLWELDHALLQMRQRLQAVEPDLFTWLQQTRQAPLSHWWWYLNEIEEVHPAEMLQSERVAA